MQPPQIAEQNLAKEPTRRNPSPFCPSQTHAQVEPVSENGVKTPQNSNQKGKLASLEGYYGSEGTQNSKGVGSPDAGVGGLRAGKG